ncbi:hypothetical protein ACLX1H_005452 [Fusarium chlamydosporum]
MGDSVHHEVVLYDLACIKRACFSPVVWKIRLMLNYKRIPYKTVFLEFPDIAPTLKDLGLAPHEAGSGSSANYTVPAIKHVPTGRYIMDSPIIAEFLELTYPHPPLPLTSQLGEEIAIKARHAIGPAFRISITPRENLILSHRSQDYFRAKNEARLGCKLEDLLEDEKEEKAWEAVGEVLEELNFFIAASLQSARTVDESVYQRCVQYAGFEKIYKACLPWMQKKD